LGNFLFQPCHMEEGRDFWYHDEMAKQMQFAKLFQ